MKVLLLYFWFNSLFVFFFSLIFFCIYFKFFIITIFLISMLNEYYFGDVFLFLFYFLVFFCCLYVYICVWYNFWYEICGWCFFVLGLRVMSETWPLFVSLWKLEFLLVFQYLQEFLFTEHLCIFKAFFERILPNFYPIHIVRLFRYFKLL